MAYIDFVSYLTSWEMTELILPFFIIFTVLLVALERLPMFERRHATIIAAAVSLISISGHVMGFYPDCWDIVSMMQIALPKLSLVLIALAVGMAVIGFMGLNWGVLGGFVNFVGFGLLGFVAYTFITSSQCVDSWDILDYVPDDLLAWVLGLGILGILGVGLWFIFGRGGNNGGGRPSDPYA